MDFRDEHIASRRGWCRYVFLKTTLNRSAVEETDEFIAQIRRRLEQTMRRG
jgi:hypothetical protein